MSSVTAFHRQNGYLMLFGYSRGLTRRTSGRLSVFLLILMWSDDEFSMAKWGGETNFQSCPFQLIIQFNIKIKISSPRTKQIYLLLLKGVQNVCGKNGSCPGFKVPTLLGTPNPIEPRRALLDPVGSPETGNTSSLLFQHIFCCHIPPEKQHLATHTHTHTHMLGTHTHTYPVPSKQS